MKMLIVSLHDVSPHTWERSRRILQDLQTAGVGKVSLLVIPDHHHRGHFLNYPEFCEWLLEMEKLGHEIVTHGYFHQRERNVKESIRDKMITRFYTAHEGEFYDISEAAALEKLERAQREFRTLGITPVGFIAPAWLLSSAGEKAVQKSGFRYTTTLQGIRLFPGRVGVPPASPGILPGEILPSIQYSQSLVYSVRSAWRRIVSIAWNRFLLGRLENNLVVRLGIHPPDWDYLTIRKEILQIVKHLSARREVITYADWTAR